MTKKQQVLNRILTTLLLISSPTLAQGLICKEVYTNPLPQVGFLGHYRETDLHVWDARISDVEIHLLIDGDSHPSRNITLGAVRMPSTLLPHKHPPPEIYFFRKGFGIMYIGGGEMIHIRPGTLVFLPANTVHFTKKIGVEALEAIYMFPKHRQRDVVYEFEISMAERPQGVLVKRLTDQEYSMKTEMDPKDETPVDFLFHVLEATPLQGFLDSKAGFLPRQTRGDTALFVEQGFGDLMVNGQSVAVSQGSYYFLPEGATFSLQNTSKTQKLKVAEFISFESGDNSSRF